MKLLSTKWHGILDYILAVLLIASPWLFNFAENGMQLWVPVIAGILIIIYSMMTAYEPGLSDNIRMRTHLVTDMCVGVLLALSPWVFGFYDIVFIPHVAFGGLLIVTALLTYTTVKRLRKLNDKLPSMPSARQQQVVNG